MRGPQAALGSATRSSRCLVGGQQGLQQPERCSAGAKLAAIESQREWRAGLRYRPASDPLQEFEHARARTPHNGDTCAYGG